jgi:hypothetical protein
MLKIQNVNLSFQFVMNESFKDENSQLCFDNDAPNFGSDEIPDMHSYQLIHEHPPNSKLVLGVVVDDSDPCS